MKYRFRTRPFKHQVVALKRALKNDHIGLLWEPGTGKSKFVVDWACALHMMGKLDRVLIVCPLSVVGVWQDEWEKHATVDYHFVSFDKNTPVIRVKKSGLHVVVANYDIAWRRKERFDEYRPQMVVADESHRIKKPSTRRSWFMRSFNRAEYRAILTGTPTPKSLLDLYGQWVFLNPKRFGTRKADFVQRYIVHGGYMNKEIRGYINVTELRQKVRADASIVKKESALDLPERTFTRTPVVLEDVAYKMYERMAYELFIELDDGEIVDAKNVGVKLMKLQQITGGFIFTEERDVRQVSRAKLSACHERLTDLVEAGEKVVVFARFLPEVDAIYEMVNKMKVPAFLMKGGIKPQERDENRRKFQSIDGPGVFVAQIQTGGLGITLHSARYALFYSVTYALDDYIQACDRIHRIGQERKVTYEHLVARNSVDLDIYAALRAKEDVTKMILADPTTLTQRFKVG